MAINLPDFGGAQQYDLMAAHIMETFPESEWPLWVKNRSRAKQSEPLDQGTTPFQPEWLTNEGKWKIAAMNLGIPADYTPADPYDIHGKMPLINAMEVKWWEMPPDQAKQVIVNAFRATMLSPRMNLKSNAILYQSLMDIPADESDPTVFENRIRDLKAKWDTQGQMELGQQPDTVIDPNEILPGKLMPGFWGNLRRLAGLGPFVNDLYRAAMDDIEHGGKGQIFRNEILHLDIPGVQSKVASFAWLALSPNTSELATLDVHMMRHLNEADESPKNAKHYLDLEDRLRNERDEIYGTEVPLSHYQWGVWDSRRTPGYHQDHTPLRAYQPTPFTDIAWPNTYRPPRPQRLEEMHPEQQSLLGKWNKLPRWSMVKLADSYSLQGETIAGLPNLQGQGIAVRPDRQSQAEIESIIEGLSTHKDDQLKQKKLIPDWAINRGGKVAMRGYPDKQTAFEIFVRDILNAAGITRLNESTNVFIYNWVLEQTQGVIPKYPGIDYNSTRQYQNTVQDLAKKLENTSLALQNKIPGKDYRQDQVDRYFNGIVPKQALDNPPTAPSGFTLGPDSGFTYAPGVICVAEWVTTDLAWLLLNDACLGIVAEKGGAASHAVVVARTRNIPVIVNVPEASRIQPGDHLQIDSGRAIIDVNGGQVGDFGEAKQAELPIIRFVWSNGQGKSTPVPQDDPESGVLHQHIIMEMMQAGQFDRNNFAMGVIYPDGKVQMTGNPTDEPQMEQWLQTIHPIQGIQHGFEL